MDRQWQEWVFRPTRAFRLGGPLGHCRRGRGQPVRHFFAPLQPGSPVPMAKSPLGQLLSTLSVAGSAASLTACACPAQLDRQLAPRLMPRRAFTGGGAQIANSPPQSRRTAHGCWKRQCRGTRPHACAQRLHRAAAAARYVALCVQGGMGVRSTAAARLAAPGRAVAAQCRGGGVGTPRGAPGVDQNASAGPPAPQGWPMWPLRLESQVPPLSCPYESAPRNLER